MFRNFQDWESYDKIIADYLPRIFRGEGYLDLDFLTGVVHIEPISETEARLVYRPNCTTCRMSNNLLSREALEQRLKIYFTKYRLRKWTYVD